MVIRRVAPKTNKSTNSELYEFGILCFIFVIIVRVADNDHDLLTV